MMRRLFGDAWIIIITQWVFGAEKRPTPLVRSLPMPLTLAAKNIRVNMESIERLEHLHSLGFMYREHLEAAANEAVYLLGLDPAMDGSCEDIARSIVLDGVELTEAIEHINNIIEHRKARRDQC